MTDLDRHLVHAEEARLWAKQLQHDSSLSTTSLPILLEDLANDVERLDRQAYIRIPIPRFLRGR